MTLALMNCKNLIAQITGMNKSEADTTIWRGTNQGDLLKAGGLSGFSILFGGWRTGFGKFNFVKMIF
ncbi:MAG: hypothetical protein NT175_00530 [Bacteroidetes bacterium]|nr:hypothetical protein [Bacteroidota bacterium]